MGTYTGKFVREAIPCGSITWPSQVGMDRNTAR